MKGILRLASIVGGLTLLASTASPNAAGGSESPSPIAAWQALPPPDTFDPRSIEYIGSGSGLAESSSSIDDLWTGRLGGADMVQVTVPGAIAGRELADGALLVAAVDPGGVYRLVALGPDGTQASLVDDLVDLAFTTDVDGRAVYAARGGDRANLGVWRYDLDGSAPARVLPPMPGALTVATAPDGLGVAQERRPRDEGTYPVMVRTSGRPVRSIQIGRLIGFDAAGRVVGSRGDGLGRYDLRTNRWKDIAGTDGLSNNDVRLLPAGRTLVAIEEESGGIRVIDLVNGGIRRLELIGAGWLMTPLGDDRHAVLQHVMDGTLTVDWYAVVDVVDGWVGYVPFQS
jgi:hypothetical protein